MINLTEQAVKEIARLREANHKPQTGLRVAVVGGGCSGMSYKLDFTDEPQAKDKVFEQEGVRIFIDAKSYLFLKGLTLDYQGGLNGKGFSFINPNASKSCGCGNSFAV